MAGIEDLRLFRSQSSPGEWLQFNPKHPTLDWRYPYQGRWYTGDINFARGWMGSGNIIKELNIKSPIPIGGTKTITDLLDDLKTLKKWVPPEGMGQGLDQLRSIHKGDPLITKFEEFMKNPNKQWRKFITLVPPKDTANKGSVNVYESIMKNLRKPTYKPWLISKYNESWLSNLMGLPKKIKYLNQLKEAGVPMHSGVNWRPAARFGLNTLRTIGGIGNVALAGQALLDAGTGSHHTKNMMTDINRMIGVPMDRQGNVIQSNRVYENLQNVAQRDVLNPNEMRGVTSFDTTRYNPREMNTGGIATLV
jgi:hypothetical protein